MSFQQPRRRDGRFASSINAESSGSLAELDMTAELNLDRPETLTDGDLERMAQSGAPLSSRLVAAGTGFMGTAVRAAADPDPLIRAQAWWGRGGLEHSVIDRLERDRAVRKVIHALTN